MTVSSRRAPVANGRRNHSPIPLNSDGPIAWIVRPSFGSPHRPKLQATLSRPRRHPCVGDDATQRSRRMDITSSCRRCSFPLPRTKRLPMARPTAAPTMQLSPTQSADDFARSRIDQRSWSWPSCATKTCARFWRVSDFPESIEEVRPPWSPVWCAGCTRGPRVLSPSPGACSVHRDRPPHRTVDRALARMLAVVPPLGRPRRPTTCRSMTSMPRLSCRRPTRFSYLELQLRPWTWTHQTKTQIERPTATSRPSLPFCRQFLPFPLRRASSRLQPPIPHSSRSPLPARHPATQPLRPERRQRSPVHQALRRSAPFSSARKRRCRLSSKLQPLSKRIHPVLHPGPSSRNSHPSPCASSPQRMPASQLRTPSVLPEPPTRPRRQNALPPTNRPALRHSQRGTTVGASWWTPPTTDCVVQRPTSREWARHSPPRSAPSSMPPKGASSTSFDAQQKGGTARRFAHPTATKLAPSRR